jgi:hypothetical protein
MPDLSSFKRDNPEVKKLGSFSEAEIAKYKGNVPDEIIELWQQEGQSTYANGFLRVVLPDAYFAIFKEWGIQDECFVFMITIFGNLIYTVGEDLFQLDPHLGQISEPSSADSFFDFEISYVIGQDGDAWQKSYEANRTKLPELKDSEMLTLVPDIEEGGSPETSALEVADLLDRHKTLADQYDNYLMEEDDQDGEGDMDADDVDFNKINVKLAIIACLNELDLYKEEAGQVLNAAKYTRAYRRAYFGSVVPQVLDYYTKLKIPQEHLDQIIEFNAAAWMEPYGNVIYDWGGEEEYFDITEDLNGIEQLTKMEVFDGSEILKDSPDISALLKCPSLKKVILGNNVDLDEKAEEVIERLREKGVEVKD